MREPKRFQCAGTRGSSLRGQRIGISDHACQYALAACDSIRRRDSILSALASSVLNSAIASAVAESCSISRTSSSCPGTVGTPAVQLAKYGKSRIAFYAASIPQSRAFFHLVSRSSHFSTRTGGIGCLHVDTPNRDSLACDIMEPTRPKCDAFVLHWLQSEPLRRSDFWEDRNGNCRIASSLAIKLCETSDTWRRLVAPVAEYVAQELWSSISKPASTPARRLIATRLTQRNKREVTAVRLTPRVLATSDGWAMSWVCSRVAAI